MTQVHLREGLEELPSYRQGKPAPARDIPTYKLSSNENPYPPLPSVVRRVSEAASTMHLYPDMSGRALVTRLAERYDVDADCIVLGSGSVEIASQLMRATAGAGDEVLFAWRSFEAYPTLAIAAGATPVMVPLTDSLTHDFDEMLAHITPRTRVVLICNPNNPTGTVVDADAMERFIAATPDNVLVVIDEAYQEFNRAEKSPVGIEVFRRHDNVMVAHTFSKAYGLAGMRIGYAVAPPAVADALRKVAIPFGVTSLAQEAALASLDAIDELAERVDKLVSERDRIQDALKAQGWAICDSQANFVWLPTAAYTDDVARVLDDFGIVGRVFSGEGIRISIGLPEANDVVIAACAAAYPATTPHPLSRTTAQG